MHFSLRSLLVATTAVAIYVGGFLGILRTMNGWQGAGTVSSYNIIYMLSGLPQFVLLAIAAVWAFDGRDRPGFKPLLWGLALTAAWRFLGPLVQMAPFQLIAPSGPNQQFFFAAFALVNAMMQTASWAVLFYAFVKASAPRPAVVSPWEP
jgi:hypothetical protein